LVFHTHSTHRPHSHRRLKSIASVERSLTRGLMRVMTHVTIKLRSTTAGEGRPSRDRPPHTPRWASLEGTNAAKVTSRPRRGCAAVTMW
jgi:hypothetical protein